jgi:hypothetical protein
VAAPGLSAAQVLVKLDAGVRAAEQVRQVMDGQEAAGPNKKQ